MGRALAGTGGQGRAQLSDVQDLWSKNKFFWQFCAFLSENGCFACLKLPFFYLRLLIDR